MPLTLAAAQTIVTVALDHARKSGFKPLGIVVLDQRGVIKAAAFEDGTSLKRYEIAHGKAFGAVALGTGSRALAKRVAEQPHFIAAARHAIGGALVPRRRRSDQGCVRRNSRRRGNFGRHVGQ